MATLTVQDVDKDGLQPSLAAADVAGDEFVNTGKEWLRIDNGDASPHTVTIAVNKTVDDLVVPDRAVAIPAGETRLIGPLATGVYNDADKKVQLSYDDVTSVTIGVFKLT